ncbi:MAG TPA: Xaa-Pro peptidase family protein, partial [Acidimicrobiales bacterium]|nr:Xaa-Pro peptidase family protein [Acidimicrobiales bacterium]
MDESALVRRTERVRSRMAELEVDVLLLSLGADLPWLTGYQAMPLERLTMLVLPVEGDATLVVPRLEAPRVDPHPDLFDVLAWDESEDPAGLVADLAGRRRQRVAVSDRTWATFVLRLQEALPECWWLPSSQVTSPLRAVKDPSEIDALRRASAAADRVAAQLIAGDIPLVGRTEAEVSRDIGDRLLAEGHQRVNFAIVGSGPNSASPHHDPGPRVIGRDEAVVCDFGGTLDGYCSDITRTVFTGRPPIEFRTLYDVLEEAQAMAVGAATVGTRCQDVDLVARSHIHEAGFGDHFVHRTGHGIGLEEHEDPYIAGGNTQPLAHGHAFSIEPGIYVRGRYGARIEDIVVATDAGPEALNKVDH